MHRKISGMTGNPSRKLMLRTEIHGRLKRITETIEGALNVSTVYALTPVTIVSGR